MPAARRQGRRPPRRPVGGAFCSACVASRRPAGQPLPDRAQRARASRTGSTPLRSARAARELVLDRGEVDAARGEQHVQVVDEVGRLRDERARRSPRAPRVTTSTASSPTFARTRPCPRRAASSCTSPPAASRARSEIVRQSAGAKHESEPVWHAGPSGRTRSEQRVAVAVVAQLLDRHRVAATSRPCASTPRRERLQNHASPDSRVRRSASSSIHASISTRPVSASWTIAARSSPSGGITERHPQLAQLVAQRREPLGILVQDRREQRRLRDLERLGDVARVAGAARGDHRDRDRVGDRAR